MRKKKPAIGGKLLAHVICFIIASLLGIGLSVLFFTGLKNPGAYPNDPPLILQFIVAFWFVALAALHVYTMVALRKGKEYSFKLSSRVLPFFFISLFLLVFVFATY